MSETVVFFDRAMIGHDPGPHHPESPERLRAIESLLASRHLPAVTFESPAEASVDVVARVHDRAYVDKVLALRDEYFTLDPDTHVSPGSVRAALLAAGAATAATDAVCSGENLTAFAMVRPPGHHAERSKAMGFCLFNNVAVAAEHARAVYGLERVMIIDWDVHHGNGTQNSFYEDPGVLFVSTHQFPFYPGSGDRREVGRGRGEGFNVNVPFSMGATDGDYKLAFNEIVMPIAEQFAPQLVLVSAGFDAHARDPLGGMRLSADGFAELCGVVKGIADRHADGRLVLLLEGGYDLDGLADSVLGCVEVMSGETPPSNPIRTGMHGDREVRAVVETHRKYWKF